MLVIVGVICEKLDFVCYFINYFMGKMGFSIVEFVVCYGVKVMFVMISKVFFVLFGVEVIYVELVEEMY